MNRHDFYKEYPSIAVALGSSFHDGSAHDDQRIAREIRGDLPAAKRTRLIQRILADLDRLLPNLDKCWDFVAEAANRQLVNQEDTREWLDERIADWNDELERLREK